MDIDKALGNLKNEIREIASATPENKRVIGLVGLRKLGEIAGKAGGIADLVRENKVVLKTSEQGSDVDVERANRDLKAILATIESCCELASLDLDAKTLMK